MEQHPPTLVQRQVVTTESGVPEGFIDEHGRFVPFWYTRTGMIIKFSVFLGLMVLFTAYILIGYWHAKRRVAKNLPPLGYHRWLVSRADLARVDPRYAYPQSLYMPYRPGWGPPPPPGGPQQQYYNMQGGMAPPPPMYDPNGRPPVYGSPEDAAKGQQQQYAPPSGPPPPGPRPAADEEQYGAPSGPPPAAQRA